ncbi:hypothetical protein G7046_g310 [Stylonectria norvegica]|nr:hypothetical protein G7046_g310 [Stylonectria norvegica]
MSADLFAEFNDLSNSPPPQPPPSQQPPKLFESKPRPQAVVKDPFDFLQDSHASVATSQPASPWPSYQARPASTGPGTWGNIAAAPKPSTITETLGEDEDGWGDFEVAQPVAPAPTSVPAPAPAPARPLYAAPSSSPSIAWHSPAPVQAAPQASISTPSPSFYAAPSSSPSMAWNMPAPAPAQSPAQAQGPTPSPYIYASSSSSPSIAWNKPAPAQAQDMAQASVPTLSQSLYAAPSNSPSTTIAWHNPAPSLPSAPSPRPAATQEPPTRTRIVRASTFDLISNNLVDIGGLPKQPTASPLGQASSQRRTPEPVLKPGPKDANVLFDAEDFELQGGDSENDDDDDDFGDFETVTPAAPLSKPPTVKAPQPPASLDLLSLVDLPQSSVHQPIGKQPPSQLLGALTFGHTTTNYPQAPRSPSFQDRNPFPDLAITTPTATHSKEEGKPKSDSPETAWPTLDEVVRPGAKSAVQKTQEIAPRTNGAEDDWAAWESSPVNTSNEADVEPTKTSEGWGWHAVDNVKTSEPSIHEDTPPPMNVPPPSIILSIFPDLLNAGNSFFKPVSGQNASIKQRILSDPKATEFLQGYILLGVTAARVMAGRKQRWHRDKILAKSMSISAAGSKGMKLAGVDKTQSIREDREAADVVAAWKQQVGRLRSAVAAANAAGKDMLKVPELDDNMHVQTAKMVPTAAKACIICGLKRDERVAKVDHQVEDSFGEWWTEHWGHKACKNFWVEHEQALRQR